MSLPDHLKAAFIQSVWNNPEELTLPKLESDLQELLTHAATEAREEVFNTEGEWISLEGCKIREAKAFRAGAEAMREACANKIEINTCGDKDCDHDVCVSIRAQMARLRSLPLPGGK